MKCLACGCSAYQRPSSVRDLWFGFPGIFEYHTCTSCTSLQQIPMPSEEILEASYSSYYTHCLAAQNSVLRRVASRTRRASLLGMFPSEPAGTVLDFGCGSGEDLLLLRDAGWDCIGVEPDPAARRTASSTGWPIYADIAGIPDGQPVQFVLMRHVIEHVVAPVGLLSSIRDRFPGVEVVVITPNARSLGRRLFRSYWRGFDAPRHVAVYSSEGLELVASSSGFADVSVDGGATSLGGIETASLLALVGGEPRGPLYAALRVVGAAIGLISSTVSWLLGATMQEELFARFR